MKNFLLSLFFAAALASIGYVAFNHSPIASANPSRLWIDCSTDPEFATTSPTHVATSTLNYMTGGTATTTLGTCSIDGIDHVDLFMVFKASSTATELRWRYEYSWDNIAWYLAQEEFVAIEATSTVRVPETFTEYSWTYASSTSETSGGNADTAFKRVQVRDLAARYMRVKFYLPPGSANGAVYAEMLRKEQFR